MRGVSARGLAILDQGLNPSVWKSRRAGPGCAKLGRFAAHFSDQRFAVDVREAENTWLNQGIRGVPAMIFNRRHPATGAQGVDNCTSIPAQLAGMPD